MVPGYPRAGSPRPYGKGHRNASDFCNEDETGILLQWGRNGVVSSPSRLRLDADEGILYYCIYARTRITPKFCISTFTLHTSWWQEAWQRKRDEWHGWENEWLRRDNEGRGKEKHWRTRVSDRGKHVSGKASEENRGD